MISDFGYPPPDPHHRALWSKVTLNLSEINSFKHHWDIYFSINGSNWFFFAFKHPLGPEEDVGSRLTQGPSRCKCIRKSMFDRYYCIKTFCHSKTSEKMLWKVPLSCTSIGTKIPVTCESFENAYSRANVTFILTTGNYICCCAHYWWWCQILWWPRNAYM